MPLYEYRCTSCGKKFERIQKFSNPPVATCPDCGASVEKLVSSPAFHLKGSGWYATDYAKPGQSKSDESGKPAQEQGEKADKSNAAEKTDKGESATSATDAKPAAEKPKADAPKKSEGSSGSS